jgi:Na+-driven multidrug efflux pump
MTIIALGMPFFSIFRASMGYFNGTGRTEFNLVMSLSRLWGMRLSMCYFFSLALGAAGIWYGMAISNMTSAAIGIVMVLLVKIDSSMIEKRRGSKGPLKM